MGRRVKVRGEARFGGHSGFGARIAAIFFALLAILSANNAWAQANPCTLEHTDAGFSTLRVVAGSPEATVLDTSLSVVWLGMRDQGCFSDPNSEGKAQDLLAEDRTGNPNLGPELGAATINYADGSIVRIDRPGGDSRIRFTPGSTTGPVTIFTGSAVSYAGSLNSKPGPGSYPIALYTRVADAATDMITVIIQVDAPNAPTASVAVNPTSVFAGASSVATVTIANNNNLTATITGIANTINLPAGVTVAATPGASTTCGGILTAAAGASTVTLAGGSSLVAGASCTMTFNITPSTVATHTIPSGTPSATGANAGSPGTTATLTATTPPLPPTIAAAWDAANVAVNAPGRKLTVTLTNPNAVTLTGVGFNAATLASGFNGTGLTGTCTGTSYNSGTRQLAMSGFTMAAGASCTAVLDFTVNARGAYTFTTGTVFATGPVALTGTTATTGTLTVWSPPTVTVAAVTPININAPSTVTLTYANPNSGQLTGVGTTGVVLLPSNVVIHSTPGVSAACGGSVTALAGDTSFAVGALTVPGGGSCAVSFNITATAPATYAIPSGTPISSQGGAGVAGTAASLVVNNVPPVLNGFTAAAVAYNSGSTINALTRTGATNNPTIWTVSQTAGGTFATTAQSTNGATSNVSITNAGIVTYAAPTGYSGNDTFFVRAANSGGVSNIVAITVPVGNPTLAISRTGSGVRGVALAGAAIVTTGGQAPYSCGAPSVALQADLTLNPNCTITGTPSVAGVVNFTVDVTDSSTGTPFTQTSPLLSFTVAPPTPTITSLTPNRGTSLGGTSVQINGTNFDSGQVTGVTIDGASVAFTEGGGTTLTVITPAHAVGVVPIAVTTTGGTTANTSADDYTFIAPPAAPSIATPANGARTGDNTPAYSGAAGAGLTITVYVDGISIGTTTSTGGGSWSLIPATPLPDGAHTVHAVATDADTISSADSAPTSFTIDTAAPAAPVVTAPISGSSTNDTTPTFTGTAEADSTVRVYLDGSFSGFAPLVGTTWSYTPAALANATYSFWATATDLAGNLGTQSTTGSLTIDTVAPAAPVIVAPSQGAFTNTTPTLSGTTEANATVTLTIDASPFLVVADASGNWSYVSAALGVGAHVASATARDVANNTGPASAPRNFTVAAVPVVTSVSPGQGPTSGSANVLLGGSGFSGATAVSFGGTPASFTVNSANQINATAPAGSAGTVNIIVTTASGTSVAGPGSVYTYVAAPSITGLAPAAGPVAGANPVILTGTALSGVTELRFGANLATGFTVNSDTQITATAPSGSGTVSVTATSIGGISVAGAGNAYTYVIQPLVTNVSPAIGPNAGGITVTLTGSGLSNATSVVFGGNPGTNLVAASDSEISVTAPAGAGAVNIVVTTPGGTSVAGPGNVFTYVAAPTVTNAAPGTGPEAGGTSVVLTGTNLTGATAVKFGATAAAFTFNSDTQITAITPAGSGAVNILVTAPGGTSAAGASNLFTYAAIPTVTALSPSSGDTAGGTSVTLTGTGFTNATAVRFGATPATGFTFNSATSITATAPQGSGIGNVTVTTPGGTSAAGAGNAYAWTPPVPVVMGPVAGSTTADTTPTYSGTAQANVTVNLIVDGGPGFFSTTADGAGNWSYTQAAALADGVHSVAASATVAGVTSAASTPVGFTVDASAPATPVITAPINNATTSDNTPTIGGTAEAGATVAIYVDGGLAGTTVAAGGNWSFTATLQADGAHTVHATATDGVGNVSGSSTPVNFTVDTAAPAAPVVVTPANGAITSVSTPTISGTAEANAIVTVYIDGASAGTTTATGGSWSFMPGAALADGLHTVRATAADAGGNASVDSNSNSFTVDASAPAAPAITAPADGLRTNVATQTISGTGESGGTVTVYLNGTSIGTTVAAGGLWSLSTGARADGPYAVTATVTDAASNVSPVSATLNYTIDTAAPAAPVLIAPADELATSDTTPPVSGTAEPDAAVTIVIDGAVVGTVTATGGVWSYTGAALPDGVHTVRATATDATSNVSASSPTHSFTVDTLAPAAPVIVAPASGSTIATNTPLISGTAEGNATVIVSVDGAPAGTVTAAAGGAWSFQTVALLPAGNHNASATATDAAGNVSGSGTSSFLVEFPPVPSDLSGVAVPYETAQAIDLSPSIAGNYTSVAIGTAPAHGTASIAGAIVTYTPAAGYYGADSFTYSAAGPGGVSSLATVTLAVATPGAPTTTDRPGVAVAYESGGTAIDLTASITGVSASMAVATAPAHGTTSVAGNVVTYVPAAGYYGADSFTFTATGPGGTSNASTVSLTIGNPPAPVAADRSGVAVAYDSPGTAIDLATSISGVRASIAIVIAPAHGTASVAGEVVTYTPTAGYFGADSFSYAATGPGGTSTPATVGLTVATPAAPVAANQSGVAVTYDSPGTTIDLAPSISGVHASIAIAAAPVHGTASASGDVVTYTPASGYYGADSFIFTATGPGGTSNVATVSLIVATPAAPTAAGLSGVAVAYDSSGTAIDLSGAITGAHSGIAVATAPAHGTTSINGDVITYTPTAGYYGADSLTYTATGPGGTSAPASVSLTVATPAAPVVADRADVAVPYSSPGTAIDLAPAITGVHASIALVAAPTHGTASVSGDVVTYTPTTGYYGADSFTYTATGPGGTSNIATVGLAVALPPPPVASDGSGSVAGSTSVNTRVEIDLSALVTGEYGTIQIQTQPAHGTVALRGAPVSGSGISTLGVPSIVAVYQPNRGFVGTDSFTFVAVGPGGSSAPAAVTITVLGSVPVAEAKTAATGDGETISVVLTTGATEGPFTAATIVSVTPAASATATIVESGAGASRAYRLDVTPAARFGGTVVVSYTLANAYGVSAPATVTVTVSARPDPATDPSVRGISDAQAESTRRFARSQVSNFMRRSEQLHGSGGGSSAPQMGVTLNSRDGRGLVRSTPAFDSSALAITERMRPSGEDPALGRIGANRSAADRDRPDQLGSMAMAGEGAGSARAGNRRGVAAAATGAPQESDDGTRRVGSVAIWSGGAIDIGTHDATTDRAKITATTSGLSGGADLKLAEGVTVGLGGGYGNDLSRIAGGASRVRAQSSIVAAYASLSPVENGFIDAMIGRGDLSFSTRRLVSATNATALGSRDGKFTVGAVALGIDRTGDALSWSIYGRGEYMDAELGAYTESGSGRYDLRFSERQLRSLTGTLGARIELRQAYDFGTMTPRLRGEWSHEFADADTQWLDYADIPGIALYSIDTTGWTRDQFQLSLGSRLALPNLWSFDVEAGFRGGAGERAGTLRIQVSKEF